jgi:hypothetical protein
MGRLEFTLFSNAHYRLEPISPRTPSSDLIPQHPEYEYDRESSGYVPVKSPTQRHVTPSVRWHQTSAPSYARLMPRSRAALSTTSNPHLASHSNTRVSSSKGRLPSRLFPNRTRHLTRPRVTLNTNVGAHTCYLERKYRSRLRVIANVTF